jgi:hypothetical protein
MSISRYLAIPLLAAASLAVSTMLLPIKPAGAQHHDRAGAAPISVSAG